MVFGEESLSIQKMKNYFVFLLWLDAKLSIVNDPLTFVEFIDWVDVSETGIFLYILVFFVLLGFDYFLVFPWLLF